MALTDSMRLAFAWVPETGVDHSGHSRRFSFDDNVESLVAQRASNGISIGLFANANCAGTAYAGADSPRPLRHDSALTGIDYLPRPVCDGMDRSPLVVRARHCPRPKHVLSPL